MVASRDEIKHLGWLSRIDLSEDEVEAYAAQIEKILRYLDVLDSVPSVEGDRLMVKSDLTDLREDKVEAFGQDPLGTSYRKEGFVKGPRMVS